MTIRFIEQLADVEIAFRYVEGCFLLGQILGHFSHDRSGPMGGEHCLIATTEWRVPVGFATFYPVGNGRAWIDLVWVEASHRRLGLGRKLIEAVKVKAPELGLTRLEFGTAFENGAMRALGAGMGFSDRSINMSVTLGEGRS
jgi:GNAT superfamily N-acetyltransferase